MEVEVVVYQEEGTLDALTVFLRGLKDKNDVVKIRKLVRFLQTQGRELGAPISKPLGEGVCRAFHRRRQAADNGWAPVSFRRHPSRLGGIFVVPLPQAFFCS